MLCQDATDCFWLMQAKMLDSVAPFLKHCALFSNVFRCLFSFGKECTLSFLYNQASLALPSICDLYYINLNFSSPLVPSAAQMGLLSSLYNSIYSYIL